MRSFMILFFVSRTCKTKVTESTLKENCDVNGSLQEKPSSNSISNINLNKESASSELIKTPVKSTYKKDFEKDSKTASKKKGVQKGF